MNYMGFVVVYVAIYTHCEY